MIILDGMRKLLVTDREQKWFLGHREILLQKSHTTTVSLLTFFLPLFPSDDHHPPNASI